MELRAAGRVAGLGDGGRELDAARAADDRGVDVLDLALPALEARELRRERLEGAARLEARERGAQAEVHAEAEPQVPLAIARHAELAGVGTEAPLVAIGRADQRRHD